MWSVKLLIAGEMFVETMEEIGLWLNEQGIDTTHFSCARDASGSVRLRISFNSEDDALRFARRFDGTLVAAEQMLPA